MSVVKTWTWASILKGSGMDSCSVSCLLRLEADLLHHRGPQLDIGFEPRIEFLRRARDRLAAELGHAPAEIGIIDDGADMAGEEGDDVARRAGPRHQRIPAVDRGIEAALAKRRHVRLLRRALAAGRGDGADLVGVDR